MSLTFYVPPGIGDFSAMYAKLCNIDREIIIRSSNDSPNRLSPFLDILPNIKNGEYAGHNATIAVGQTLPPGTDLSKLSDGDYFLAVNTWLEEGGKVADWIPGKTTYHYKMSTEPYISTSLDFLRNVGQRSKLIGVYCSAYGNSRHWGFWTYEAWREFLESVIKVVPEDSQFIFIGAEYDLQIAEYLHAWMASIGVRSHLTLGAFHIGATVEIIRQLDYFFVFPSGLGFLADVVDTPHTMWFPNNLDKMRGTFCDPENYERGQTIHSLFSEPKVAFEQFKRCGLKFLEDKSWRQSHAVQHPHKPKSSQMSVGKKSDTTHGIITDVDLE